MSEEARFIRRAIQLARQARERGDHSFGSLLVADAQIVLEAENTVVTQNNPTHHVVFSFSALELGTLTNDRFCAPCTALFDRADRRTEVVGPILPDEGREVHEGFWKA